MLRGVLLLVISGGGILLAQVPKPVRPLEPVSVLPNAFGEGVHNNVVDRFVWGADVAMRRGRQGICKIPLET